MYPLGTVFSIQKPFYKHVGVYIGGDYILHNNSRRGEEIVTLAQFSEGNPVFIEKIGVTDPAAFVRRVKTVLAAPRPYDLFSNNCDHTVSKVRTGIASSPQLAAIGFAATFFGGIIMLARAA